MTPHVTHDRSGVTVTAAPGAGTELDSFLGRSGATGVEWQVTNDDPSQTLTCYPQTRAGSTADWVTPEFAEELMSVGPGESKRAMWRFMTYEVRLVGIASGAGLSARLWRNTLYGVQL